MLGVVRWTFLSGSPRVGEEPGGAFAATGAGDVTRAARSTAWVASVLLVVSLAGFLATVLELARVSGVSVALFGIAPAAALSLAFLGVVVTQALSGRFARGAFASACGFASLAIVLAVTGHVLHPRGASLLLFLPPRLLQALGIGFATATLVTLLVALLTPLVAGARVHALALGLDATGMRVRSLRAVVRALGLRHAEDARHPVGAGAFVRGAFVAWGRGFALPGLLALDLAATTLLGLRARLRGRARDRIHVDAPLDVLGQALEDVGASVETESGALRVRLPGEGARPALRLTSSLVVFPDVSGACVLDVEGPREELRRFRRLVRGELAWVGTFAWSATARRLERRLNALAQDGRGAVTMEERALLLDEASRLLAGIESRRLSEEEWTILLAWKGERLRSLLLERMTAPLGARPEGRVVSPGPALAPDLEHVLDAGGLSAVSRLVFVPYRILPAQTPWGPEEVVVNALTETYDADESDALLDRLRAKGPGLFLDVGRNATFLPVPKATASVLRSVREALPRMRVEPDALDGEVVYVPFLSTPKGHVNAVTGRPGPDLGRPPPRS